MGLFCLSKRRMFFAISGYKIMSQAKMTAWNFGEIDVRHHEKIACRSWHRWTSAPNINFGTLFFMVPNIDCPTISGRLLGGHFCLRLYLPEIAKTSFFLKGKKDAIFNQSDPNLPSGHQNQTKQWMKIWISFVLRSCIFHKMRNSSCRSHIRNSGIF